ncbi:MAG: AAA family ATPase [Lachnospiraceae bacterium]|nr:AAA family ATPase [Lachnospiraceae bacterium]
MNIAEAKEQIRDTVRLYLKKDELGDYVLPLVRQRPIFLLGAPGIGKTAIMEQIASELGIALVSYSMTHHTRQSALGLPFIAKKDYGGKEFSVSEYTMSEIIASVYDTMEESGLKEGILFLDEINCVSETLYPSMLQFLQYKVFGRHRVPEGWVVVTAGNPPEYNRMVREFDVVTLDRVRLIETEADLKAWQNYAYRQHIHPAIVSYLELRPEDFYRMELTAEGREYVTARGWEDLSRVLLLCEEEGMAAGESVIRQYLHHETVVKEFAAYYELYRKYEKDYSPLGILKGEGTELMRDRVREAPFDERILLSSMLSERIETDMRRVLQGLDALGRLQTVLKAWKAKQEESSGAEILSKGEEALREKEKRLGAAQSLSDEERSSIRRTLFLYDELRAKIAEESREEGRSAFGIAEAWYMEKLSGVKEESAQISERLKNLFCFAEEAFGEGQELLLLLTRLTVNADASRFIALFGSEEYSRLSAGMMVRERGQDLRKEIEALGVF